MRPAFPILLATWLLPFLLLHPAPARAETRLGYASMGPMLHWNFSGFRFASFSFGFEFAYWSYARVWQESFFSGPAPDSERPGFGLALGFDSDKRAFRLYAEPQIGWVLAGASLGPVLEFPEMGAPARWGVQGSGWVNAIGGLDLRYRYMDGSHVQSLGVYAKLVALTSGRGEAPE